MKEPAKQSPGGIRSWAVAGGGVFLTLAMGASSLLRAVFLVLAGRLLGPEPYAELYAALSLVFLLGTGLTPLASAIAHYTSLYDTRGELGKVATLRREMPRRVARWSGGLVLLGLLSAYPMQRLLGFGDLSVPLWIVAALVLTLQVSLPRGFLRGMRLFRAYGLNALAEALLRLAIAVPLLMWSASAATGLAAFTIAGFGALLLARMQVAPVGAGVPTLPVTARLVEKMVGPLLVFALATAAFQNLDMLFVNKVFAGPEVGVYAAASSLAKLPALAFLPFSIALLPIFTTAVARGESLLVPLLRAAGAYLVLAGGVLGALALWGRPLVVTLFGEPFAAADRWLVPLAAAATLTFLSAMIGQAYCAAKRYVFLLPFLSALVLEVLALAAYRSSLESVPWVLLAVQAVNLGMMILVFAVLPPRTDPTEE